MKYVGLVLAILLFPATQGMTNSLSGNFCPGAGGGTAGVDGLRASTNYRVADTLGQFVVSGANVAGDAMRPSSSTNYIDEHGFWHFITPSSVSIGSPSASLTTGGPVTYTVTYTGATSINLTSGSITLNNPTGSASGTVSVTNGTTATPTVTISSITGNGTLGITIAARTSSDGAGNFDAGAGPSGTFTVDNTNPSFSSIATSTQFAKLGAAVTITFTASEPLLLDPTVLVNTHSATKSSQNGQNYTYGYTIQSGDSDGAATIGITGTDMAGNIGSSSNTSALTVDKTVPTVTSVVWHDTAVGDESPTPAFLKGTLSASVSASDSGSGIDTVKAKRDGELDTQYQTLTLGGDGKYAYMDIDASWSNGEHTVYLKVTDRAGNSTVVPQTFTVNKNEIGGSIGLQGFTTATTSRSVTFVLNGTITKTLDVTFISGTGTYTFTDVPDITSISAKTAWSLRKKMTVTPDNGQSTANFTGDGTGGYTVLGGDLNGDNVVNALDYSVLRSAWGPYGAGDITGDGWTNNADYLILKGSWYKKGDEN